MVERLNVKFGMRVWNKNIVSIDTMISFVIICLQEILYFHPIDLHRFNLSSGQSYIQLVFLHIVCFFLIFFVDPSIFSEVRPICLDSYTDSLIILV
jgi:hypothetical protein